MAIPAISKAQIEGALSKIRSISERAHLTGINKSGFESGFTELMKVARQSLDSINASHNNADKLKDAYLKGDAGVSLPQVLVSSVESKLAFEGLLVVRNKLIDAYKEILNMPL